MALQKIPRINLGGGRYLGFPRRQLCHRGSIIRFSTWCSNVCTVQKIRLSPQIWVYNERFKRDYHWLFLRFAKTPRALLFNNYRLIL